MGDFNLDARMNHRMDYNRKVPLKLLNDFALENHLIQIVNFNTWSRNIRLLGPIYIIIIFFKIRHTGSKDRWQVDFKYIVFESWRINNL